MRRRDFIKVFGGGAVAWPLAARAQDARKPALIGYLTPLPLRRAMRGRDKTGGKAVKTPGRKPRRHNAFHLKEKHRPLARTARRSMSLLALGLLLSLGTGSKAQTPNQNENLNSALLVIELTAMVAQHGWVANLGRICPAMRIGAEADCRFKQISVSASPPGTIDNHGFNVQLHSPDRESAIIIFHLGALVGNFFILSRAGELKSAFYRARGLDYMENSVEEARPAFEASLTFWRENLPKLKELIAAGNLPRR